MRCILATALIGVSMSACTTSATGPAAAPAPPPVAVETVRSASGPWDVTTSTIGSLRALDAVALTTRVPGIITTLHLAEGQLVERGAVLVELDSAEETAAVREAQVERDNAARELERSQPLVERGIVNANQLDDLRAKLAAFEARLGVAAARLEVRRVAAPFSGRLGLRQVSVGSFLSPGTIIATLSTVSPIQLGFSVPESFLGRLKPGLRVEATAPAFPGQIFSGEIEAVDAGSDPSTHDVSVRARFANAEGSLVPGLSMNVQLVLEHLDDAVTVPEEAIVLQGAQAAVFAVAGDGSPTVKRTVVALGQRRAGRVQIREGLPAGVEVVVQGLQSVRDGAAVQTRPAAVKAGAEAAKPAVAIPAPTPGVSSTASTVK